MYYTSIDKQNKILLIYLIVGRIFKKKIENQFVLRRHSSRFVLNFSQIVKIGKRMGKFRIDFSQKNRNWRGQSVDYGR